MDLSTAALAAAIRPYLWRVAGTLAVIVLIGSSGFLGYRKGVEVTEQKYKAQTAEYLAKEKSLREKELALNAREAAVAARETQKLDQRLNRGLEKFNEAVDKAGAKPECDLTDDEWMSLVGIGNEGE